MCVCERESVMFRGLNRQIVKTPAASQEQPNHQLETENPLRGTRESWREISTERREILSVKLRVYCYCDTILQCKSLGLCSEKQYEQNPVVRIVLLCVLDASPGLSFI